ncbi:MAG: hypothetical protein WEB52_04705 [Dehalococcoidia bacterium]
MAAQFHPERLPKGFDERRVRNLIAEGRAYSDHLARERSRLIEQHEGQWVASYKGQFLFEDSMKDVLAAAKQSGWPLDVIAIDHLTRRRAIVLL